MKIRLKRLFSVTLVLAMLITSVSSGFIANAEIWGDTSTDYISFGKAGDAEVIWRVLEKKADGSLVLITKDTVGAKVKYNSTAVFPDYANCSIKTAVESAITLTDAEAASLADTTMVYNASDNGTKTEKTLTVKFALPTKADFTNYNLTKANIVYWLADAVASNVANKQVLIVSLAGKTQGLSLTMAQGLRVMVTIKADAYSALPAVAGVTYTAADGTTSVKYAVAGASIKLNIGEAYSQSAPVVKFGGVEATGTDGVYTVGTGTMTVEGVQVNPYADYTAYDEAVAKTQGLVAEHYTEETWAALQTALAADVANLTAVDQAKIDAAAQAIEDAFAALEALPADTEAYKAAVAAARELLTSTLHNLNASPEGENRDFNTIINLLLEDESKILAKTIDKQADVDAATKALKDLCAQVPYKAASLEKWTNAVNGARALDPTIYYPAYVAEVNAAVDAIVAEKDYEALKETLDIRDQADIDAAAAEILALYADKDSHFIRTDFSALEAAIERARNYVNNENTYKRTSAWEHFAECYNEAIHYLNNKERYELDISYQNTIDCIAERLIVAIEELDICKEMITDPSVADLVTDKVIWSIDIETGTLYVGGSGKITYSEYRNGYVNEIESVVIFNGITEIDEYSFYCCSNASSIMIPDSVILIGEAAFEGCSGLKKLNIPASAKIFNSYKTFNGCTNIEIVTLTKGNGTMQNYVTSTELTDTYYAYTPWFQSNNSLKELIIENGITSITDYAFYECSSVTTVIIPESVTYIGICAFSGCKNIENINLPQSVNYIGKSAFYNCKSLKSITIPYGLTSISDYTFYNCSGLMSIIIPDSVTVIGTASFAYCSSIASITIPDGVTLIGAGAFGCCSGIKELTMPVSAKICNEETFYGCTNIEKVFLTKGTGIMQNYNENGFNGYNFAPWRHRCCETVIIEEGVTNISDYAFATCQNISNLIIPDSVTAIGEYAFYFCTSITAITIPNSVTTIGCGAFSNCSNISLVRYNSSYKDWNSIVIGVDNECLTNNLLLGAENERLHYCGGEIGEGVEWCLYEDGELVFRGNGYIPSYTLDTAPWFARRALVKTIVIDENVTSIGKNTFYDCENLSTVILNGYDVKIANGVFDDCDDINIHCLSGSSAHAYAKRSNITYTLLDGESAGFTIMNDMVLNYSGTANSPVIPVGVTSIGSYAFMNNDTITSIVLPHTVTDIYTGAFAGCDNLDHITIPESVNIIASTAFNDTEVVFVCVENSYAHRYATEHGITCDFANPVTGVELNYTSLIIFSGSSAYLNATVTPSTAQNTEVIWTSSDKNVALVDENGLVTAGSTAGVATITACTVDGGFTASCVIKTGPHATDLYISDSQILLVPGFTHALTATVMPLKAVYKDVNWASTNEAVASVDENGVVTAHKSGTAIVIAETDDGSIAKTCQVTVNNSTKVFELSSKAEYIGVDASVQLKGVFIPENAENKAVIWTTSDSTIATVDENGLVTGKKAGSVVITATTIDGGHKDYCIVRVVGITGSYANTVVDAENGCIYGLGVGMDSLDDYVVLTDNSCDLEYDSLTNELGTGTVANIVRDGEIVDSYTVVIFGDVNGDGWYDGEDAFLVNLIAKGMLDKDDVGEAIWTAADCNHDGEINEADVDLLTGAGLKLNSVDQSKTVAELSTNSDYIEYVMLIDQSAGMNPGVNPDVDDLQQGTTDTNTTPENPADGINIEAIITTIFDFIKKLFAFVFSFIIK